MRTRRICGALVALALAACGGDTDEELSIGPDTGPTAATGATSTTGETGSTGAHEGTPLVSGPLEPGTYTFDGFDQPITFTIGEGWEAFIQEPEEGKTSLGAYMALFHEDHPVANLAFIQFTRVVDPEKDWDEAGNLVVAPEDIVAWMAEHPYHEAQAPFDTTVGELPARAVDIFVARVPRNGWPACGGQCVLWFPIAVDQEDGPFTDEDEMFGGALEEYDRQIVVEVGGQQLLADIGALKQKAFEKFVPLAEEVLATVQFS